MSSRYKSIDNAKLFLEPPKKSYKELQIDRESMTYITTPHNAIIISRILQSNLEKGVDLSDITIFDGTSGVGGDLIVFGHTFGTIIGCEMDKDRFKMLENNVGVYELHNVTILNEDCLKTIFDINFIDIVYLDPPWGGKNYKTEKLLTLRLGDMTIESIVNDLLDPVKTRSYLNLKLIVLKLPKNYNIQNLYYETKHSNVTLLKYELEKMLIMVFKINNAKNGVDTIT
jgi:16S rRNA G966 N2-methylase RsmD